MAGFDDLMLLERVFLRLGSAETDDQLENLLGRFLTPVLLKLSSPEEAVRKKVMELLIHINKRVKTRPQVQLPVEALLAQFGDPSASSFITNFTVIYIKLGLPRLPLEKQAELVPIIVQSLENKPVSHLDSIILLIIPVLGKMKLPTQPEKMTELFKLNERPGIAKHMLEMLLDMLLLPYGALTQPETDQANSLPVPPCMSLTSFRRLTHHNPMKPEELEEIKLGIVKFVAHGFFKNEEILIHLIVAAADTRFSIANLADMELKKVIGLVDWSSLPLVTPLFNMFLGDAVAKGNNASKPADMKLPASTRIRLKLLTCMCRISGKAFAFPASIQLIFDCLYGTNTNTKLKTLVLNYTMNLIRGADKTILGKVAPVLQSGLQKLLTDEGIEETHKGQAYVLIGLLGQRFPKIVYHNVGLLETFFKDLETANPDLKLQAREGLLHLILAYKHDTEGEDCNKDGRLNILLALIKLWINSPEDMVRFVAVRALAVLFPANHVPSKYLLLVATGDLKDDVTSEAFKSLYGTSRKSDIDLSGAKKQQVVTPPFAEITSYIYDESQIVLKSPGKSFETGNHVLAFNVKTFNEIILYLRLCLLRSLDVPLTREVLVHPCEFSPVIGEYLRGLLGGQGFEQSALYKYGLLIKQLLTARPSIETFGSMIELVGCVPQLHSLFTTQELTSWLKDQLSSTKEEIRENAAVLYGLILNSKSENPEFNSAIEQIITQTSSKNLEQQHGATLALGNCLETRLRQQSVNQDLMSKSVNVLVGLLKNQNAVVVGGACSSLGQVARCLPLPLEDGKKSERDSPDAKRPAKVTKIDVVTLLMDVMNNGKYSSKIREKAAKTLGLICIGESQKFVHAKEIIQGLLNTAKETKDVEVHFTIGESLVMCCQSIWSPEGRNSWTTGPKDHSPKSNEPLSDDNLDWVLTELLKLASQHHPNSRQASCIWLLAVLKGCGERDPITRRLKVLQNIFMDLLCENNDIVQDAASKGLCLVYDTYKSEDLLQALVKQLTSGTRQVSQVSEDTKLFEEGQLGKSPIGGNLTTYKELCSLASDLNKPDLIYQFMHLANHNAMWNSKKGAAFGFSSIAERCGEDLQAHLPLIVPKLYRYQFDPTPSIQLSMQNIWRVLVPEPQKVLDQYYDQILADLLENINSNQYRVRQSCCLALQDFLKGTANRSIHDCIDSMGDLWHKVFRVMDDHHEATRLTATKTARILSKLCVRGCDLSQGKDGVRLVEAVLPPLLSKDGITSSVAEIRMISLQTISELVGSAGKQLKPFLPKLIPALLQATGELESTKLSYLSTMLGAQSQAQETVDSARASFAKSHFTTETVSKSLQYADASILEELVPRISELLRSVGLGLGTRIATAHFVVLLSVQMPSQDLQPHTGKLLAALVTGLTDRNGAIRKHYASAVGHLVSTAKDSSLEKLFGKLQQWYFEREDDTIRSACALTIQAIGLHNQEILKSYKDTVLPLVFFAMHCEKSESSEATLEIWNEIWSENSPGTETGIRQNLDSICGILKTALESPSWTVKSQAANAVSTVATKLKDTLDAQHAVSLISILLTGLSGRTWTGKDKLLKALASICSNCKDSIVGNTSEVRTDSIIDAVIKECKKEEILYKIAALECLGDILSAFEVDKFDQVYTIIQPILGSDTTTSKNDDDSDDASADSSEEIAKKRQNLIKLKETAYETLGKTWPEKSAETQLKYRQMFVEHCADCLPRMIRTVQVSVLVALYSFVDKLILSGDLSQIVDNILRAVKYSLSIPKHTRLRKEALNVIFCMGKKLKEVGGYDLELKKLVDMFGGVQSDLSGDHQPEIKSRLTDIKKMLI